MTLKSVFKKAASTIVKAFGDIPVTVSYTIYGDKSYDSTTDKVTAPETVYENIKMFFGSYKTEDISGDENIQSTDIKALVASEDLPSGIKPSSSDLITVTSEASDTIRSGDTFKIIGDFKTDQAEALFTVHLRAGK